MKRIAWMAGVVAALAAAACGGTPGRVPVSAAPGAAPALVGEWAGEYQSPATGRGGSIVFHLDAGRDTAEGDVVMVPRGAPGPLRRAIVGEPGAAVPARQPTTLTIRLVRVEGDRVSGQMDPYTDPECACALYTTFEGTVRGGRIEGTFTTRGEPGGAPVTGTWQVERRAP
ncbi:MAG TPA: hypothetical protein VFJ16_22555 [Longimicrobium sp.]|nr:hypothetical protein [Longimicrobium sp.]